MFDVTCMDKYGNTVTYLTQWDSNQTLYIEDHGFTTAPFFHFCNKNSEKALVVASTIGSDGVMTVLIPNSLLTEPYNITAYVYLTEDTTSKTVEVIQLPVRPRPMPDTYEYVDDPIVIDLIVLATEIRELNAQVTLAEENRVTAETIRISNEEIRKSNENVRIENEDCRIQNENNRDEAETVRIEKENERTSAESIRVASEIDRVNAENIRIANENDRVDNEVAREDSESDRLSAELERVNNEQTRISNENVREQSEDVRIENEEIRITQERARESNTNIAIGNVNLAINKANTAIKDVEDIVTGVNNAVEVTEGNKDLAMQYAQQCSDTLEAMNQKLQLATFDLDENGNLIYTDDSAYAFSVTDDGNLNWSVS